MTDINAVDNTQDNLGGIFSSSFIPIDEVASLPPMVDGVITDPILLPVDVSWYTIRHKFEQAHYKERYNDNVQNGLYNFSADFYIPYVHYSKTENLREMTRHRFLLITYDYNRNQRLAGAPKGSLEHGLHFKYEENVADKVSGENGYKITFFGEFCVPAVGYDLTALSSGGSGGT